MTKLTKSRAYKRPRVRTSKRADVYREGAIVDENPEALDGREFCVEWSDGSTSWMRLTELFER
ncbi:MAG: hypothetical protein IPP12_22135 [Nitrospira sp.]|nr:hypothetical protein [Nitrospira sp.]